MTNSKSHTLFRLVPKSSTWDGLEFSRNFALLRMFGKQQRLNGTRIVSEGIVAHWKYISYFSTMYRLRWYCLAFLSEGRFSEFRPIYQWCLELGRRKSFDLFDSTQNQTVRRAMQTSRDTFLFYWNFKKRTKNSQIPRLSRAYLCVS